MEEPNHEYFFDADEARMLKKLQFFQPHDRERALKESLYDKSRDDLIQLLSDYIGIANSVVKNCHDAIRFFRIMEGEEHPDRPGDSLNLPTLAGAFSGLLINQNIDATDCCETCVFRHGSIANQSPITTDDAQYCCEDVQIFWCHEDGANMPCKGWAKRKALMNADHKKENRAAGGKKY